MNFFAEIWSRFRPYSIAFLVDLLISTSLWIALFLFKMLTSLFPIEGWVGEFIRNIHAVGVVATFTVFALLFAVDTYRIHQEEYKNGKTE